MQSIPTRLIVFNLCVSLFLGVGCNKKPSNSAKKSPALSSKESASGRQNNYDGTPPADRSLTIDDYIEAGIPSHERSWSGADMTKTAKILASLAQKDMGHLPRYQSGRSGKLFERITTAENLEFYRDTSLPLEIRMPDAMTQMQALNQIMKLYLTAAVRRTVGESELVELVGSSLRVTVISFNLVEEFLPTLDKNDPSYPVRMDGLKKMKKGFAEAVAGSLQTLASSEPRISSDAKRLIGHMRETFPTLLQSLSAQSRKETLIELKRIASHSKMKHLQSELNGLLAKVREVIQE